MPDTVRVVSDGEEMVLSEGERFRVQSKSSERRGEPAARRLAIQYVGFKDVPGRREYTLHANRGDEARKYTVWIALAAFAKRQALPQDGPDICYQKLSHELANPETRESVIEVTDRDLAAYRETHAPPVRRSFSPARPAATTTSDSSPTKDGKSE
jgi:hypothetical protein